MEEKSSSTTMSPHSNIKLPSSMGQQATDGKSVKTELQSRNLPSNKPPPLWQIHSHAPIRTFPLPTFYPQNPLSLVHLISAWISQIISPPRDIIVVHEGIWSPETRSVHVADAKSIRALWEQGFYGKGHLSRSEPNWAKLQNCRFQGDVAEAVTNQRRDNRKQMKWERALKEQEAIHRIKLEEAWVAPVGPEQLLALPNSQADLEGRLRLRKPLETGGTPPGLSTLSGNTSKTAPEILKTVRFSPDIESVINQLLEPSYPISAALNSSAVVADPLLNTLPELPAPSASATQGLRQSEAAAPIQDKEHLQLTMEEAFFLTFGFGVLSVKDPSIDEILSVEALFNLFRQYSSFPPKQEPASLEMDDPFLIHYAVYHHFRSLGWVVRPGIKFGADWLLYNRGPAFSHAEFALMVIPSHTDEYWKSKGRQASSKSWEWLHGLNRIQSVAFKTLVLVYVDVPAPQDETSGKLNIPAMLSRFRIREFVVKRWLINRNRE